MIVASLRKGSVPSTREMKTSNNQIIVSSRVSPRNFLTCSIQIPGLGRNLIVEGKSPVTMNGKERPKPIIKNMRSIVVLLEVKAKVSAVPRNGAEHGVESMVARTPLKKSPTKPSFISTFPSLDPPGVLNSNRPKRFRAIAKSTITMIATNRGD